MKAKYGRVLLAGRKQVRRANVRFPALPAAALLPGRPGARRHDTDRDDRFRDWRLIFVRQFRLISGRRADSRPERAASVLEFNWIKHTPSAVIQRASGANGHDGHFRPFPAGRVSP